MVGPPLTVAAWVPLVSTRDVEPRTRDIHGLAERDLQVRVDGDVDRAIARASWLATVGAVSGGTPVTEMSSMPTHSSLPGASVVMTRIWTTAWLFAAEGSVTLTGVTRVARLGPLVASATYPAGTFVNDPDDAEAVLEGDLLEGVVRGAIDVAQVVGDVDVRQSGGVDGDHDARGVGRRRALDRDDGVGELELGDAPLSEAAPDRSGWRRRSSVAPSTVTCCGSAPVTRDVRPEESGHAREPRSSCCRS